MHLPNLEKILKETPLDIRLRVSMMMDDYENWDNGVYKGNKELIEKQIQSIIRQVKEWIKDGQPK